MEGEWKHLDKKKLSDLDQSRTSKTNTQQDYESHS